MIFLDLETVAINDAAQYVEPDRRLVDPVKIAASRADRVSEAALYPWTARIIALGWGYDGERVAQVRVCNSEPAEKRVIEEFLARVRLPNSGLDIVGTFNGRRYDLPVLMARCRVLGIPCPSFDIRRYGSRNVDMMDVLTFHGELSPRSLTWFARRFGLDTSDAFSGREVAVLHEDGNWDAIKKHCESDVTLTRQLAERCGIC
jgi:predicted PolB exonuclease-like 3'-5' exonuclease